MNVVSRVKTLLDKTERILKDNIYEANKYPWGKYRLISPDKRDFPEGFPGVWNWDTAFHAIAMIEFDMTLAKEQVLGFLQFQKENGLLPDVVFENGDIEERIGKPPVMADAAWRVYEADKSGDKDFLVAVFTPLVKNALFWESYRMCDGLFHYDGDCDKTDKALYQKIVGWESGWDNSPRWDNEPQNYYTVDLNCYMVTMYRALAKMAKALGYYYQGWEEKARILSENIENRLWNEELGSYCDYNYVTKSFSKTLSPAAFMPLYIGIASKQRAEKMNEIAKDHFLPGMPTVAYDDPSYCNNYWRGPCWLNVAYFAAKGLKDYGFVETAETVKETILDWVYNDGEFVHENYDAKTGEGLYASNYSWSCVFVRQFIFNF